MDSIQVWLVQRLGGGIQLIERHQALVQGRAVGAPSSPGVMNV